MSLTVYDLNTLTDLVSYQVHSLGPLSARQRNAILWRFAGGPIVARF